MTRLIGPVEDAAACRMPLCSTGGKWDEGQHHRAQRM